MKHIFIVHSNITEMVMEMVIKYKNLDKNKVLVFYHRNYEPQDSYEKIAFPFIKEITKNHHSIFEIFRWIKKINQIIGSNYFVYIPHSQQPEFSLLSINRRCKGYYYIEEGLICYHEEKFNIIRNKYFPRIEKFFALLNPIYFKFSDFRNIICKVKHFNISNKKHCGSFALSKHSFVQDKKRVILNPYELKHYKTPFTDKKYNLIIIFDACVIYDTIHINDMLKILNKDIGSFIEKKGFQSIAFKLHPEHFTEKPKAIKERNFIRSFFHDKNIEELDKNFPIENYLLENPETNVLVFYSSIGHYASLFGCRVYSIYKKLYELNNLYKLPKVVEDNFIDIYSMRK